MSKERIEELQAECNKWQERLKIECEYTEGITKKKVAREIFEEIEKVACVYKLDGDFYIDNGLYAELKKKYTEGKV